MPRLTHLAHRQKTSRLRDALAALVLLGAFVMPSAALMSAKTSEPIARAEVPAPEPNVCGPTSLAPDC